MPAKDDVSQNRPDAEGQAVEHWLELASATLAGDKSARTQVSNIAHPLIEFQTDRFCRRYCFQNKYNYACTLKPPAASAKSGAPLCDWANASYVWMLEDLSSDNRLKNYEGRDGASLKNYFSFIANSKPFYERWKNWRFGRRVHVPTYIEELGDKAKRIFLALRDGDSVNTLAQKLVIDEVEAKVLSDQILIILTQRNRLHLLDPPQTRNFSELTYINEDGDSEAEFGEVEGKQEVFLQNEELLQAWQHLDTVEQFVIEAMVVDEQDAEDVLVALKTLDLSLKKGVPAEETDRQQLYYFKRKTMAKLAELMV